MYVLFIIVLGSDLHESGGFTNVPLLMSLTSLIQLRYIEIDHYSLHVTTVCRTLQSTCSTIKTISICMYYEESSATIEETLCVQVRNATVLKTLITPTPNTTHTNPQVCGGF